MPAVRRKASTSVSSKRVKQSRTDDGDVVQQQKGQADRSDAVQTLADVGIGTSEELVKALKSGNEPTTANGKHKIAIASIAWHDDVTPVPRKAHLLADWILNVLFREARAAERLQESFKGKQKEDMFAVSCDARYWTLLRTILKTLNHDELQQMVGRQSILPLLSSVSQVFKLDINGGGSGKDEQRDLLDVTSACFQVLDRTQVNVRTANLDILASAISHWLEVLSKVPDGLSTQAKQLFIPMRILVLAWSELGTTRKARQAFLQTLLHPLCQALARLDALPAATPDILRLRSCLCRLSYETVLIGASSAAALPQDDDELVEQVCKHPEALGALPTLLQQRCLALRASKALSDHAHMRDQIWERMASRFLMAITTAGDDTPLRLAVLLKVLTIVEEKHLYPTNDREEAATAEAVLSRVVDYALTTLGDDRGQVGVLTAFQCLEVVHHIDELAVRQELWMRIIGHLAISPPGSSGLLKSFCGSHSRTRSLNKLITLFFDGLQMACTLIGSSNRSISEGSVLDQRFWEADLGLSLQNFIGAEQSIDILRLTCQRVAASIDAAATNAAVAQVHILLSARVITFLAMPTPMKDHAVACLRELHDNAVMTLRNKGQDTSLVVASLQLIGSITRRSMDHAVKDGDWRALVQYIDNVQMEYIPSADSMPSLSGLRVEFIVAVLERTKRELSSGMPAVYATWLDTFVAATREEHIECLDTAMSAYLQTFERIASSATLDILASRAIEPASLFSGPGKNDVSFTLVGDAAHLELPRWRNAVLDAAERYLADGIAFEQNDGLKAMTLLDSLSRLPFDYIPRSKMASFVELAIKTLQRSMTSEHPLYASIVRWLSSVKAHFCFNGDAVASIDSLGLTSKVPVKQSVADAFRVKAMLSATEEAEAYNDTATLSAAFDAFFNQIQEAEHTIHLLAPLLAQAAQRSSINEYEKCLDMGILRLHGRETDDGTRLHPACQSLAIVLCNGPEGALALSQTKLRTMLACLSDIVSCDESKDVPASVCLIVCHAIESVVLGKALLFRSREISTVLALFANIIAPRRGTAVAVLERDRPNIGIAIYTSIITSLVSLVRLRTEALAPILPQLSIVVAQTVSLFRQPARRDDHPSLPMRKSAILPAWLDVRLAHLGVFEARQMTRLCSAITARSPASSASSHQVKRGTGLARAFGNHAVPVLLSYIRSLTLIDQDRGTLFAMGETRQELMRAMFALCDVVGTWQRNVMMDLMADEGERIICRQLWRNYEGQRYRGE